MIERKRQQEDLKDSHALLTGIVEGTTDAVFAKDREGRYLLMNSAGSKVVGKPVRDVIGRDDRVLFPPEVAAEIMALDRRIMDGGEPVIVEERTRAEGRDTMWLSCKAPYRNEDGEVVGLIGIARDITERVRIEEELSRYRDRLERLVEQRTAELTEANRTLRREIAERRAAEEERHRLEEKIGQVQKLESLGVLAGGVAHDFNNLLVGIVGYTEFALRRLPADSDVVPFLEHIKRGSQGAADLCDQLLAYSGKGRFVVEAIDLSRVAEEMLHLLETAISKNARLGLHLADDLPAIEGDPTQIRQVVMNLVLNASEAIGERGGTISLTTAAVHRERDELAETYLGEPLAGGAYVSLEISDTGCGMDDETSARVFDPFFTTKFTGRGLGLAAVLGIVRGHKGAIEVSSEADRGTRIRVLFPALDRPATVPHRPVEVPAALPDSGTILLVDDNETVRTVGTMMLEDEGFTVLTAADGIEALEVFRQHQAWIECVVLDLTMPRMDGAETLRELRRIDDSARVILSTGYSEQEITARFAGQGLAGFLRKPYDFDALTAQLREVMASSPR